MPPKRMNREEFLAKLAPMDRDHLDRAMWNLYWRGPSAFRERIEAELDPVESERRKRMAAQPPDPAMVLAEVTEFTALARAGAYMGGDRRVTPKERTRWRLTFRQLADQACAALRAPEPDRAAEALTLLIDLANSMGDSDYFRSQDPVEAAGFVLSDAAALLWQFTRDRHGFAAFAGLAAPQLIRWESRYGWTRSGCGKTSELGSAASRPAHAREYRSDRLAQWHQMLNDHFGGGPEEALVDRLRTHPALSGTALARQRSVAR